MHDWLIDGLKVGYYHEASLLNEQHGFEDLHTLPGKMVCRFDIDIDVGGIDAGHYFSVKCAMSATRNIKKKECRELLNDAFFLNTKNAPSLIYVKVGTKVRVFCVCILSAASKANALICTTCAESLCSLFATHCNTLQHTATHCNTLQHTATHLCSKSILSPKTQNLACKPPCTRAER